MTELNTAAENRRVQLELTNSVNLELLGVTTCPPGWTGYEHSHPFWEVVYISQNQGQPFTFILNEEKITFRSPVMALIPPNMLHQFHNDCDITIRNMYIGFSFSFEPYTNTKSDLPLFLPSEHPDVKYMMSVFNEIANQPIDLAEQLLFTKRINILGAIIHLAKYMLDTDVQPNGVNHVRAELLVDKVKEFVYKNRNRNITVNEIANQLYISPNYLGQIFRQITGMTLKEYHNRLRLEHALALLSEGTHSIDEISKILGFESAAYFSRRFKSMYGISPTKFLKR